MSVSVSNHVLTTTREKFEKLWSKVKGSLRITKLDRMPYESEEEWLVRWKEVCDPSMPRSLQYFLPRGMITIRWK